MNFPPHLIERGLLFVLAAVVFLAVSQMVFTRFDDKIPDRLI